MSTYAIIKASGSQLKVAEGESHRVHSLAGEKGAEVVFPEVLLVAGEKGVTVGKPLVAGAKVVGEIVNHGKGKKLRIYQFKRKNGYQRTLGYRDRYTTVRIKSIVGG